VYNTGGNRVQDSGVRSAEYFCAGIYFRKGSYRLGNVAENNLNLFDTKGYRPPTGDALLQICPDLARVTLNLPLFSKTSLLTSHVYSIEHLFNHPYAVRDYPDKPHASYPNKNCKSPIIFVKTRRNPLVSNKVNLQIAGSTRRQDGLTIQGLETYSRCIMTKCEEGGRNLTMQKQLIIFKIQH
jgi:hypothetical protein